jgi:hypothetical protein
MLTELQNMYNGLKEKNEKAIIEKYSDNAKRYMATLYFGGICAERIAFLFW